MSRAVKAPLLTAALLLLASCDDSAPEARSTTAPATASSVDAAAPSSAEPGCPGARTTFGPVTKADVLTEVAPAVTITSPSGGPLDAPMRPIRRYTAEVRASGDVPKTAVYEAFVKKVGGDTPLPPLGEAVPTDNGTTTVEGAGRFVKFGGAQAVKATFDYECGGVAARGVVSSWLIPISGILECKTKLDAARSPMQLEARAHACGG